MPVRNPMVGAAPPDKVAQFASVQLKIAFVAGMVLDVKKLGRPANSRHPLLSLTAPAVTPCPPTIIIPAKRFPGLRFAESPTRISAAVLVIPAFLNGSVAGTSNHPVLVATMAPAALTSVCVPNATIPLLGVGVEPATSPPAIVNEYVSCVQGLVLHDWNPMRPR